MRKTIFLPLITICLLSAQTVSAQYKTDLERAGLTGPVKSVEAYIVDFSMKEGKAEQGKPRPWHSTSYDSEGNIVERTSYDHLGKISARYIHTYDPKGRSTGYEEYSATLDKTLKKPRKHIYTLDDSGNRIEYRVYESDGSSAGRFTYKYDAKGNKIEDGYYHHTGRFGGKTVYTFDGKGNQTSQAYYADDDALNWKNVSTYDDSGKRTESLQYEGDKLKYKIVSTYDDRGRVLENETIEFNATPNLRPSHAPVPGKVVYIYDDEKRTKEVAEYEPDGSLRSQTVYTHDERGNEIGRATYKTDGSANDPAIQFYDNIYGPGSKFQGSLSGKSMFEWEYDSHGNWTKKTYLIETVRGGDPQPSRAEQRVITYH